jgi:DUF1680 family protein
LSLPATITWETEGRTVRLALQTGYPETDAVTMRLDLAQAANFALRLRVPACSAGVSFKVNGNPVDAGAHPGECASMRRDWHGGDRIEMTIPLRFRRAPIHRWHPNRVARVRGPVVYVQQVVHKHLVSLPGTEEALDKWMVATKDPAVFQYAGQEQSSQRDDFMPFYRFAEMATYRMYIFDR